MTWKEKIMDYVNRFPGVTDRDMREYYKVINQTINTVARQLEREGYLIRKENPEKNNLIGIIRQERHCNNSFLRIIMATPKGWPLLSNDILFWIHQIS